MGVRTECQMCSNAALMMPVHRPPSGGQIVRRRQRAGGCRVAGGFWDCEDVGMIVGGGEGRSRDRERLDTRRERGWSRKEIQGREKRNHPKKVEVPVIVVQ